MTKNILKHCIPYLLLTMCCLLTASYLFAEDNDLPRPDNFFEQHFSETLMKAKKQTGDNDTEKTPESPDNLDREESEFIDAELTDAPAHTDGRKETTVSSTEEADHPSSSTMSTTSQKEIMDDSIEITHVSIVISTEPKQHLHSSLRTYSETLEYYQLKPAGVHLIGPLELSLDFPASWTRLLARGAQLLQEREALAALNIQHSPSWVLHTSLGDIILEGEPSIEQYLTINGNFKRELLEQVSKQATRKSKRMR